MLVANNDQICPLHNCVLVEDVVPILYGLIRYSPEYRHAQQELFPHSKFTVLAGCMLGDEFRYTARFCEACRCAHREWCATNGVTYGLQPSRETEELYVKRLAEKPSLACVVPDDIKSIVERGSMISATLALKKANPKIDLADVRAYIRYLRYQNEFGDKG